MKAWLAAGAAGLIVMAVLAPRQQAPPWPRADAAAYATRLAQTWGWDVSAWRFEVTAGHEEDWRRLRARHPESALAQALPEVRYRVYARAPEGVASLWVAFGNNGQLLRFGYRAGAGYPAPALAVEQLPALFSPDHPERFAPWTPGDRFPGARRPPSKGKKRGDGDGPDGRSGREGRGQGEGPGRGGRPWYVWRGAAPADIEARITANAPEGVVEEARLLVDLPRDLHRALDPPGDTLQGAVRGFGVFLTVLALIAASFRILSQIGIRRDYLRMAWRTAAAFVLTCLLLWLVSGPMDVLRYRGWGEGAVPYVNGIGFFFAYGVGRPLLLALPLAAGLLTIQGRHVGPWVGWLGVALRGRLYRLDWRTIAAALAGGVALAAIPYIAAFAAGIRVLRPDPEMIYHPAPALFLLGELPLAWLNAAAFFFIVAPWILRPESPSRLRYFLYGLAGLLMMNQRLLPLEDHGYLAVATLPLWLAGFWLILSRLGVAGLWTSWLAALAAPHLLACLQAPAAFWPEIAQILALCAAPPLLAAVFAQRRAPEEEAADFAAEIDRRNHPDTSPKLRSEREHLLSEFALAREAQEGMLPGSPPPLEGYSLAARCLPAREVGGDLFDFLDLPGARVGLCVADVSGKGVPAALYMTLTKGMLTAEQDMGSPPRDMARALNTQLLGAGRRRTFVTLVYAVLDPATGDVELIRAGHNPALWWQAATGEARYLKPKGLGLGLAADRLFDPTLESEHIHLAPGDVLVLYSDGLTEMMNSAQALFGEHRLASELARHAQRDAAAIADALVAAAQHFAAGAPAHDDLTVLVLQRDPAACAVPRAAALR